MKRLILASASPRRSELLQKLVSSFETVISRFDETGDRFVPATALEFARGKAKEVANRYPDAFVLGADTMVFFEGRALTKPKDDGDAYRMLKLLSGNTHSVFTGICLLGENFLREALVETRVSFFELSEKFISDYIKSGSPRDKAGAYGIQDGGLARSVQGSYTNVIGLPLEETAVFLREAMGEDYVKTCD